MKNPKADNNDNLAKQIIDFVNASKGLRMINTGLTDYMGIEQKSDSRTLRFNIFDLDEVILRSDDENKTFLQVNFLSGKKILLTEQLIGFRPMALFGLDMDKLPKVVTTPDIISIFEAIQETLQSGDDNDDLETLRKVYDAVLCGGESIGLDLTNERKIFSRIPTQHLKVSA